MSEKTWTVDVDGRRRTISVEHDPTTNRSTIRVDGRVAAKPMTGDETEREIPVGTTRYVVRRMENGAFDLDVPPEVFLNPTTMKLRSRMNQPGADKGNSKALGGIIGGIIVVILVTALVRVGRHGFSYMRVPWKAYNAADGTFKVNFAGDPKQETQTMNINGVLWNIISLQSRFKNHFYIAQYVDVHMVVTEQSAPGIIEQFFDGWMEGAKATVLTKEKTSLARNPGLTFEARVPKGLIAGDDKLDVDARARGVMTMHNKRMFLIFSVVPEGDRITWDVAKFIESFEVSDSVAAPPSEVVPVATPPQTVARTPPAPSNERPLGEMATPVARVYAHNATKKYYPLNCAARPEETFPMARSLAIQQGFKLAKECTE